MVYPRAMNGEGAAPHFQPFQIVCLECDNRRLYAEVVQVIEERRVCWARPLVLVVGEATDWSQQDSPELEFHDLRQGSDLLWPLELFRVAMDTEVMPLLPYLCAPGNGDETSKFNYSGRQQLQLFVQQVWRAFPEFFQRLN